MNFAGVLRNVWVDKAPQPIALYGELSNRPGLTETLVFMLISSFIYCFFFLTSFSLSSVSAMKKTGDQLIYYLDNDNNVNNLSVFFLVCVHFYFIVS